MCSADQEGRTRNGLRQLLSWNREQLQNTSAKLSTLIENHGTELVLLGKLILATLVKRFFPFYGTSSHVQHWTQSQMNSYSVTRTAQSASLTSRGDTVSLCNLKTKRYRNLTMFFFKIMITGLHHYIQNLPRTTKSPDCSAVRLCARNVIIWRKWGLATRLICSAL